MELGPYLLSALGICGTIVVAYLAVRWQRSLELDKERLRREWEDSRRWRADEISLFSDFLKEMDGHMRDVSLLAARRHAASQGTLAAEAVGPAPSLVQGAYERLGLLGHRSVLVAANQMYAELLRVERQCVLDDASNPTEGRILEAQVRFFDARATFIEAAREQLGLAPLDSSGSPPRVSAAGV